MELHEINRNGLNDSKLCFEFPLSDLKGRFLNKFNFPFSHYGTAVHYFSSGKSIVSPEYTKNISNCKQVLKTMT